jgi:hypothetical protein
LCFLVKRRPVTLCSKKMTTASPASRVLSQFIRNPPQCLLRYSKTSSTSPARNCSTLAHTYSTAAVSHSTSRQSPSISGTRPYPRPVLSCVTEEPFAKARRRFSASTVSLHNELVPPKPGEEYVIKSFIYKHTDPLQASYHFHR